MNLCFFSGIIENEPDFRFIISKNITFKDSLHISISRFNIKIDEKTIISIKAYDDLADFCFHSLKRGDFIFVSGRLNDKNEVDIDFCEKI